ncbi:hypothetical protein CDQ91_10235 [Sphingopyxis witflariensis]|uniref:Uncharacterized protein n=1 Tax=Sphingopyxis witflariensis TaxID=173675 RepID=A0A246JY51_9SPHN|nr:hypothetical protein CDQ91_10235 [Sphingopyxis witflariensis]
MTGATLKGRAGGLRPEPAAQSQPEALIPSAVHVAAAKVICRSGRFETGQGTCAMLCMEFLGDPRRNGCPHALKIHGKLALAVLECSQ